MPPITAPMGVACVTGGPDGVAAGESVLREVSIAEVDTELGTELDPPAGGVV